MEKYIQIILSKEEKQRIENIKKKPFLCLNTIDSYAK